MLGNDRTELYVQVGTLASQRLRMCWYSRTTRESCGYDIKHAQDDFWINASFVQGNMEGMLLWAVG